MKYCNYCAEPLHLVVPPGDDRLRHVCSVCEAVHYQNPRIITGCIPVFGEQVLLCRRAIDPRRGFWTLPAGFLEHGETIADGARRECQEEANAQVVIDALCGIYDILPIGQVYMWHRATLLDATFSPGHESLETALFAEHQIPWKDLAFRAVTLALEQFFAERRAGQFSLDIRTIEGREPQPPARHL